MTSTDKPVELEASRLRSYAATRAREVAATVIGAIPWGICAITAIAGALRLTELEDVAGNPFYDAAVHSMGMSWHNFLFGAFDPGAALAIDKPPLDLWLQVASTKLLGWSSLALKLPEALGGTLAVPLLYDAVRRAAGRGAGLAAAASLAVMPVSVITSRSDTMDSLMMFLVVAALWLTVRATESGARRWLVLAGVAVGLAFNVKLGEGLVAVPALMLLYAVAAPVSRRRRAADIALAAGALVVVSLSWAVAVTLAPGPHPFAIGSTNGTVFDAIFGFDGIGRLSGSMSAGGTYAAPPGAFRLFSGVGDLGQLFGCVLLAALALGGAAVLVGWRRRPAEDDREPRPLALAFSLSVTLWLVCGVAMLSDVVVMHARYLEAVTPAVAAALGCGLAALLSVAARGDVRGRATIPILAVVLAGVTCYTASLVSASVAPAATLGGAAVIAAALAVFVPRASRWAIVVTGALALACCLSLPVRESEAIVRSAQSDSPGLPVRPPSVVDAISRYLRHRTVGARFELAADNALALAPLLIRDSRSILPLTSFGGKPLTSVAALEHAVRSGAVRYALVGISGCKGSGLRAACAPSAKWVRSHGVNVSAEAGIAARVRLRLYRLPH